MPKYVCSHCQSDWNTQKKITCCPFCGNPLLSRHDNQALITDMSALISEIKTKYGKEVFSKEKFQKQRIKGIMLDCAPSLGREIQLFEIAINANIYSIIFSNSKTNIERAKLVLRNDCFLSDEHIERIINWFELILETNSQYNSSLTNENEYDSSNERGSDVPRSGNKYSLTSFPQTLEEQNVLDELMMMYRNPRDEKYIINHLRIIYDLAKRGNGDAQYYLAFCYQFGIGIDIDYEKSKQWYLLSLKNNPKNTNAANYLAKIYFESDNDVVQARKFFEIGQKNGDPICARNLGWLYTVDLLNKKSPNRIKTVLECYKTGLAIIRNEKYVGFKSYLLNLYLCASWGLATIAYFIISDEYEKNKAIEEYISFQNQCKKLTELFTEKEEEVGKLYEEEYNTPIQSNVEFLTEMKRLGELLKQVFPSKVGLD